MQKPLLSGSGNGQEPFKSPDGRFCHSPKSGNVEQLRSRVSDLPDLTDKLIEQGIHGEYVAWRDRYMAWRMGEAKGAKGENTHQEHLKTSEELAFEHWYPTVKTFTFRRTIFFWCNVCCCEGCLLFLWVPFFEKQHLNRHLNFELTALPNLCGGILFSIGIYLNYFELINLDSNLETDRVYFLCLPWAQLKALGISPKSAITAVVYLVGALFYGVAQVSEVANVDGTRWEPTLVTWPYCVGGFFFFLGGIGELTINQVFTTAPSKLVWWIALMNSLGGLSFWLSGTPSVLQGDAALYVGAGGTFLYLVAAILSLLMWRGEQFGGAIIPALNDARRGDVSSITVRKDKRTGACHIITADVMGKGGGDEKLKDVLEPRLSWKGLLFVQVYIFVAATQILSCCAVVTHLRHILSNPMDFRWYLNVFLNGCGNLIIAHMTLVLNSACVTTPHEEPYHTLAIGMRVASLLIMGNSLLMLQVLFDEM